MTDTSAEYYDDLEAAELRRHPDRHEDTLLIGHKALAVVWIILAVAWAMS